VSKINFDQFSKIKIKIHGSKMARALCALF
jgi:hypothetical protein